jgi:hypothetical protein
MVAVKYEDLSMAFDFVNFGGPMEHAAYISLDNGAICWISEDNPTEEEVPEDLETSDRYISIPHKNDLDLGADLALRFATDELPERYDRIEQFFRHQGAYGRFKELLAAEGRLDRWYQFETQATERALREWCAANGIRVIESNHESSA